jgi:hypothetical protein
MTVTTPHTPGDQGSFAGAAGESLLCERRPTEWEGWLWCTNEVGGAAWVPEAWLEGSGERRRLTRDYFSHELTVRPGDDVTVLLAVAEWALATGPSGEQGWVPWRCLASG